MLMLMWSVGVLDWGLGGDSLSQGFKKRVIILYYIGIACDDTV